MSATFTIAVRTIPARAEHLARLWPELLRLVVAPSVLGLHVASHPELTANQNGRMALAGAARDGADWVLFLEDDVGLLEDFLGSTSRWLADHERGDVHVYPLGCQYPLPRHLAAMEYGLDLYYCSVGFVLRGSMAASLASYVGTQTSEQGLDLLIARWHRSVSDSPVLLTPVPCFVEHLGDESTLAATRSMRNVVGRFQGWRGPEYIYGGADG